MPLWFLCEKDFIVFIPFFTFQSILYIYIVQNVIAMQSNATTIINKLTTLEVAN